MDTNQQCLYCVITQRIIEGFVKYPKHKEFLIRSDHPIKIFDLMEAVKEYIALENQININFVSIYDVIDVSKIEDKKKWYEIAESRHLCYEYRNGKIYREFL